ncbi:MAG: FadR family transcriptional regulator, partial [Proteobacteria bacterium]
MLLKAFIILAILMSTRNSADRASETSPSIVHQLLQYMREQNYRVDDRLPSIRQLAEMMNVSPNVVRDGLLEAQTKGMVRIVPRSGAYVQSLDYSSLVDALDQTLETALAQQDPNLFHLIEARSIIEVQTVGLATVRRRPEDLAILREAIDAFHLHQVNRELRIAADERFHLHIATIAGNIVLVTMLQALLALLRPYRLMASLSQPDLAKSHA